MQRVSPRPRDVPHVPQTSKPDLKTKRRGHNTSTIHASRCVTSTPLACAYSLQGGQLADEACITVRETSANRTTRATGTHRLYTYTAHTYSCRTITTSFFFAQQHFVGFDLCVKPSFLTSVSENVRVIPYTSLTHLQRTITKLWTSTVRPRCGRMR